MDEKFYEDLKEKIKHYFDKTGSHSFDHTQRVYNLVVKLGETENVDMDIVKSSALLHDIARLKQDRGECNCHAEEGTKMAEKILSEIGFPKRKIKSVCYSIENHRYSKGIKSRTREAQLLQDADRLDALGAITIARIFDYGGKKNRPIHNPELKPEDYIHNSESASSFIHFYEKILKIKPESFHTKKAKEIAEGRYKFVEQFVDRFLKEWEGKL